MAGIGFAVSSKRRGQRMEEVCHRLAAVGHLTRRKYDRSLNNKEPLVIRFRVAAAAVAKSKVRQGKARQGRYLFISRGCNRDGPVCWCKQCAGAACSCQQKEVNDERQRESWDGS